MPRIRDGHNRVDEYETVPPPAVGVGPIERVVVPGAIARTPGIEAQGLPRYTSRRGVDRPAATMAESRARGARAAGFVKGATKRTPMVPLAPTATDPPPLTGAAVGVSGSRGRRVMPRDRGERNSLVLDTVRTSKSHAETGERLGVTGKRIEQIVHEIRRNGLLPADVDELLKARSSWKGTVHRATPAVAEPAHIVSAESPIEGREAGAPATDALDRDAGSPPGDGSPPEPEPGIEDAYSAPDSTRRPTVMLPCEDCAHAVVCSIRPLIEAMEPVIESPHPAVYVDALSIECDHFLDRVS
jgi:hypothetical protein